MEAKRKEKKPAATKHIVEGHDLETPLWRAYYEQVRRSIRFPRYYKKSLNA